MEKNGAVEKPKKQKRVRTVSKGDGKDKTIKIKLTTGSGGGTATPSAGSDDEEEPDAAIEENLILRVTDPELCEQLRENVRKREIPENVKLQFKDNRRGAFYADGKKYDATLVDLPTIIESQKTLDKKQFFKVADISQMLLIENASKENNTHNSTAQMNVANDPYTFNHGLTPPLKHVRKRRFRKKLSKRAIEEVEREVERLLEVDATAEDVQYEVFDDRETEMENESDFGTQDIDIDESEAAESESDEDLAAAIDRELTRDVDDEDDEDNEDEDEEEESEDEENEEDEEAGTSNEIEQKRQEILEIQQAIQRKERDALTAPNQILKRRFEGYVENLKRQLALKEAHLAEMS
ncbi:TAFII55 protein conserved region-domain-containing protein [Syncephalastrum racemosum]|uniref:TAFII55 protein conserved region-domain-containing protein n=1 Tax=Syncephalastrum racemosum TaxID=13706 RepID=A0A1X2H2C4_SYNRA|nr:TAFII55 protein conserved region-domain-containing protein [Syncephalastrum racemosum]